MGATQSPELFADGTIDVKGAVAFSGLGRTVLYALMGANRLPYCQVGKKRLIPRRALIDLLAAHATGRARREQTSTD